MQEGVEGGACGGLLFLCFFPAPRALNPPICFAVWLLQRANILKFRVSGCLSVTNTLFSLYTLPSGSKGPKRAWSSTATAGAAAAGAAAAEAEAAEAAAAEAAAAEAAEAAEAEAAAATATHQQPAATGHRGSCSRAAARPASCKHSSRQQQQQQQQPPS